MTMKNLSQIFASKSVLCTLVSLGAALTSSTVNAAELPPATAIPIVFTHSIEAGKAKPGDAITAKTMQIVLLPSGHSIPKGSVVLGHVTEARKFAFDSTPYAVQQPSIISVRFDKIVDKGEAIPINVSVRALANTLDAKDAASPKRLDETDSSGTNVQIGGDSFSPIEKEVRTSDGDIVGYNRKQGVFARLISNDSLNRYASFHCSGTGSEQSVAIFSASACGLYGFETVYMPENGSTSHGAFALASRRHTVTLYAGSSALLQVLDTNNATDQAVNVPANPQH